MRKLLTLKTLLRAPIKTILTFLLLVAASFALFSKVTDFVITMREIAHVESFCKGVAALDNTTPEIFVQGSGSGLVSDYTVYEVEGKPWPTEEQIEEFSSLPGVTCADKRYMTAGLVEGYKRLREEGNNIGRFVIEGTYAGCDYTPNTTGVMELTFDDIKVLASNDDKLNLERPIEAIGVDDQTFYDNPYPAQYFEKLEKGSRCLITGEYSDLNNNRLHMGMGVDAFQVIDGLGENYLEMEAFAYQKGLVQMINQNRYTYDIVYTSDMRSIPRFNEHNMVISEGRPLVATDTDVCVVNQLFLDTYGLSIGDKIHVELGDRLFHQGSTAGAQARDAESKSNFVSTAELEVIGAYQNVDDNWTRRSERNWSYTSNTIFVPSSLLPIEVPADHKVSVGEFSVLIEDAHDIEQFQEAAEPLVAQMSIPMRFSDGGWLSMKDSFEAGRRMASLTAILSIAGAALALLLVVYLYIGRNKKTYAIMRTLGVSRKKARNSLVLPFCVLSMLAVPVGGISGLFYTSKTAKKVLVSMAASAPVGYVPDTVIPVNVILWCLFCELTFMLCITLFFLWRMQKIPPLELLQESVTKTGTNIKVMLNPMGTSLPAKFDITKLSTADEMEKSKRKKYGVLHHVTAYILRHMRRSVGKTAVSLVLAMVLTAGIGTLVLARITYEDAVREIDVKGRALMFSSSYIPDLQSSDLMDDFYCYDSLKVCVNDMKLQALMIFTNDIERYLAGDHTITYAEGYDEFSMNSTSAICLLGQTLAEELGVCVGDRIALLSNDMYSALAENYKEEELQTKIDLKVRMYMVVGVINSDIADISNGIFAPANRTMEDIYSQPFPFDYCEFTLSDNERLDELDSLLEQQKTLGKMYAPTASFYIDATGFKNIQRICGLLQSLFPIAVAAALLISLFGPGLVILQSAQEAAFLRVLGVTKKRVRCMLVLEQIVLCAAAIVLVAGGFALLRPGLFARSAQTLTTCFLLYFMGCLCGAFVAARQVTRHKILDLLQVKE